MNEESWYYEIKHPELGTTGSTGYESYDDACDAMNEEMGTMIDELAEKYPDVPDEELELQFSWDVRLD